MENTGAYRLCEISFILAKGKDFGFWYVRHSLGSYDGTIKLWDIKNLHVVCQISKYLRKLQSVSISPNSELLAVE